MRLIAGLGNPGREYEDTRHNIGFLVLDRLIDRFGPQPVKKSAFKGDLFKREGLLLLKPTTYMNLSGQSVQSVMHYYRCEELIVVHDDLDLPFGAIRYKRGGGHGGHNGLKSIDAHVGQDYIRVRMGIGKPEQKSEVVRFVLEQFSPEEQSQLPEWIDLAIQALHHLIRGETLESVASRFSQKRVPIDTP